MKIPESVYYRIEVKYVRASVFIPVLDCFSDVERAKLKAAEMEESIIGCECRIIQVTERVVS